MRPAALARAPRAWILAILLFGCSGHAVSGDTASPTLTAVAVPLDRTELTRTTAGELAYLGGFELRSDDHRFGGLSGLVLWPDEAHLLAVSDRGHWVAMRLPAADDPPGAPADLRIEPLRNEYGARIEGRAADAEAVTVGRDGRVLVSFEGVHRVLAYSGPDPATSSGMPFEMPDELRDAPNNAGLEAMTILPDGALLAVTEGFRTAEKDGLRGWLVRDGEAAPVVYVTDGAFLPTDFASLASGDVLALERSFSPLLGPAMRLRRIPAAAIRPGGRLDGAALAVLRPPFTVDNMEGLAAREGPDGTTTLYIVSDDNFSRLQRTLLLVFRLR